MSTRPKTPGQEEVRLAVTILDSLSLVTSLFILIASAWIRSVPSARHHIQRVSYKIILFVLLAQVCYNVTRLVLYTGDAARAFLFQNPGMCIAGVYFFIKELHFTNFLITCIALNLMLIVCFGVNPIEQKLLRWYVGGSFALAAFIPLVPAILGHFGQDPLYRICYFTPFALQERMTVVVLDLVLWELVSCLVTSIAVIAVLMTLFRQGRKTARALLLGNPLNLDLNSESTLETKRPSKCPTLSSWTTCGFRRKDLESAQSSTETHNLQDRFLGIALKISLYPIFLIIVNVVISVADIYFNYSLRNGITTISELAFLAVYQVMYAARGLLFAILCICIDPSFRAGLSAAWSAKRDARHAQLPVDFGMPGDKMSFGQFLTSQMEGGSSTPPLEVDTELPLTAALRTLPYAVTYALPPLSDTSVDKIQIPKAPPSPSPKRYTKVFAGVTSDSLPAELSDDVDVDLKLSYNESPVSARTRSLHPTRSRGVSAVQGIGELDEMELKTEEDEKEDYPVQQQERLQRQPTASSQGRQSTRILHPRLSVDSARNRLEVRRSADEATRRFEELNAQL